MKNKNDLMQAFRKILDMTGSLDLDCEEMAENAYKYFDDVEDIMRPLANCIDSLKENIFRIDYTENGVCKEYIFCVFIDVRITDRGRVCEYKDIEFREVEKITKL